jgi:glycosyltransferase involved in cell wall biosynthesis
LRPIPKEIKTRQYSRRYTQDKPFEGSRNLTDLAQRMSRLNPKESPPLACVHIVKCADIECTAICKIVAALAKHAGSFGYEISVLFLGGGPLLEMMRSAGVQASIVPWTGERGDFAGAWRVWSRLRQRRVQIVHFHSGGLLARVISRLAGASAVVSHVHHLPPHEEKMGATSSSLRFRGADAVIACSQAVADRLYHCRAEVIYAGIECVPEPVPLRLSPGPFNLGVLSRLEPRKNIGAVIEATARLAQSGIDIQTEIAGDGDVEDVVSLRELVARLGMNERVRFLGWQTDVRGLLATWDLLAIPSMEEGLPISALEAMASARPVVASRVGGLCELIVDGVTGCLVPPGDTEALFRCIAKLTGDRQRLAQMGIAAWHRAQNEFSAQVMAQRTAALYDRLLGRKAARGPAEPAG